ncbi:DUF3073 domain-containing protein [Schaalia sp. 19OD2882]|uniref:DUF3073 domain-containing protein n=1 Tax=Schaalia sp. 19OD2882 TaxID=2794089 RepID=UPI001C1EF676|nr:DUF3073 domain-containing protein [Schaalia sp. 19OD2882]QWW20566.1 DUF3073 domain-containing protein [Schaalia sp. 19OD2882]
MGRGRQKAKQMKVARRLKYFSPDTDLDALQRELTSGSESSDDKDSYEDPYADEFEDTYADKYADTYEDDKADDLLDEESWTRPSGTTSR